MGGGGAADPAVGMVLATIPGLTQYAQLLQDAGWDSMHSLQQALWTDLVRSCRCLLLQPLTSFFQDMLRSRTNETTRCTAPL